MGYDPSYISKIESGREPPTREFAQHADETLKASGLIMRRFREYEQRRVAWETSTPTPARRHPATQPRSVATPTRLMVLHEDARLRYDDGAYHLHIRRKVTNCGDVPATRYMIRINIDRHPGTPERSNELHRYRPLALDQIGLTATCEGESMGWEIKQDRDALKEIWLLFENASGKFPLYPGQTVTFEYSYTVSAELWGKWLQRTIRIPTELLTVEMDFPTELEPAVWGLEISSAAERLPVRSPIAQRAEGGRLIYSWSSEEPTLDTRFRFEWKFANEPAGEQEPPEPPSERMRHLGVVQNGAAVLRDIARPYDLPREAEDARTMGELLIAFLGPIRVAHVFSKGMGLAAPQVGFSRAAAVVEMPGERPLVLYNPSIVAVSDEEDEQFEGCLSFFDVRGRLSRPLRIDVEHTTLDGRQRTTTFEFGAARLWAHEVDHLHGILYADKLAPGAELIPVETYAGGGQNWRYT
jgi:peptide deformylase